MGGGYQQIMQAFNKMQRESEKKLKALDEKEFTYTANNAIRLVMKGDMSLVNIEIIDKDILDKDNADMLTDMIKLAYDHIREEINAEQDKINAELSSKLPGGFKF